MNQTSTLTLQQQNVMTAIRLEMGWPEFAPANDCIAFCCGRPMDLVVGSEMARIAQQERKDAVYGGWARHSDAAPSDFTVIYRELLTVDVIDRAVPYAANYRAPIVFVSTRADETFGVDDRGSMVRLPGKPKNIGTGRKLAIKRIMATAATLGDEMLENNRFVRNGAERIEPEASLGHFVRFN